MIFSSIAQSEKACFFILSGLCIYLVFFPINVFCQGRCYQGITLSMGSSASQGWHLASIWDVWEFLQKSSITQQIDENVLVQPRKMNSNMCFMAWELPRVLVHACVHAVPAHRARAVQHQAVPLSCWWWHPLSSTPSTPSTPWPCPPRAQGWATLPCSITPLLWWHQIPSQPSGKDPGGHSELLITQGSQGN